VKSAPPARQVTNGPEPPPEKRTSATVALGASEPSSCRASFVEIGLHDPSGLCTRCGSAAVLIVWRPDGSAKTCDTSVRAETTSTC
jgi:hypothetical protein